MSDGFRGYRKWGIRIYSEAMDRDDVNHTDTEQLREFAEEMGDLLCLDNDLLVPVVMVAAGKRSDMPGAVQTQTTQRQA